MTTSRAYDDVDLSSTRFWSNPMRERDQAYAVPRRERPVSWQRPVDPGAKRVEDDGYWAVVTHADVSKVERRHNDFSCAKGITFEDLSPEAFKHISFLAMDPPRHSRVRRLVSAAFTSRSVTELQDRGAARARIILVDLIAKGPGNFVELVAKRLFWWAINEMVGVPEDDGEALAALVDDQGHANDPPFTVKHPGVDPQKLTVQCLERLADTGQRLADERRRRPQSDLMTAFVQASVDSSSLTSDDIGDFFNLLIKRIPNPHIAFGGWHTLLPGRAACMARNPSHLP